MAETEQQAAIVRILEDLIAFASVSASSNLDIVGYIKALLASRGIAARHIPSSDGSKASLLASIGPIDRPGIVLSAHTDVVPAEGQDWSSPPFAATHRNGRIYGRGATDMKGFLAVVLASLDRFAAAATETPVHLALSYDEEIGCRGAPDLARAVAALPATPVLAVIGEPTGLKVVRAHKGKVARRITVTGRGGHSALPHRGANAVTAAVEIGAAIARLARRCEAAADATAPFDPPWTTVHIGSVHGGGALNLIPDRATLEFEIRSMPDADVARLLAEVDAAVAAARADLRRRASEADVACEEMIAYPALATKADAPAVAAVQRLAGDLGEPGAVSFGTEAGIYAAHAVPAVVCGPGDIARAHKADEWIGLDELAACAAMMARLAAELGRPASDWIGL